MCRCLLLFISRWSACSSYNNKIIICNIHDHDHPIQFFSCENVYLFFLLSAYPLVVASSIQTTDRMDGLHETFFIFHKKRRTSIKIIITILFVGDWKLKAEDLSESSSLFYIDFFLDNPQIQRRLFFSNFLIFLILKFHDKKHKFFLSKYYIFK